MRAFKLKLKDLFQMKSVYKLLLFLTVFWFLVSYDTNLYRLSVILDYLDFREIQFMSNQSLYSSLKYEPGDRAILNTLHRLQHPLKCSDQRLLIFDANTWHCGFGCSLHTIVYQLHLAYQTNRTLIVKNSHILNYFEAIGVNCPFNSDAINSQVIRIAEDDVVYVNRRQSAIKSKDISLELLKKTAEKYSNIHKEPVAWLIGQFVSYIMQYSFEFQMRAARYQTQMGFKTSCVGVHVRRTDKAEEARLFELADYMQHVSLYYKAKQEKYSNGTRCVFLITDDMDIIAEAKTKFKEYQFIFNEEHAKYTDRFDKSNESLESILVDVYLLSQCEYLVCTLSSNIGRLVSEIWSTKYDDLAKRLVSLDTGYGLI